MNITVLGLGHVGSVVAGGLANSGHEVLGIDANRDRVAALQVGESPFFEPGLSTMLASAMATGRLKFGHPEDEITLQMGIIVVAVDTPQMPDGGVGLSQVESALDWTRDHAPGGSIVVMKSTIPPGTGVLLALGLNKNGLGYASNPEFLRTGHAVEDWENPSRIVIGADNPELGNAVMGVMYFRVDSQRLVTDITTAEMIKYASNAFLATRISFINEIANICGTVGANVDVVSKGLAMDRRIEGEGTRMFPGIGYGGPCLSKDIAALRHLANANGVDTRLISSVIDINEHQRLLPVESLRKRFGNPLPSGINVAVLGLAFKPGTDVVQDAPAIDMICELVGMGAVVRVYDPRAIGNAIDSLPLGVFFCDNVMEATNKAEVVILATEWQEFVGMDWELIARDMCYPRFLFDGRNMLNSALMRDLGFEYVNVG